MLILDCTHHGEGFVPYRFAYVTKSERGEERGGRRERERRGRGTGRKGGW